MEDTKIVSLYVILLASFGLWLHSRRTTNYPGGKLIPVLSTMVEPSDNKNINLAQFVLAFFVYLFVLSLLSPKNGMILTVTVVMGALLYNQRSTGSDTILNLLGEE